MPCRSRGQNVCLVGTADEAVSSASSIFAGKPHPAPDPGGEQRTTPSKPATVQLLVCTTCSLPPSRQLSGSDKHPLVWWVASPRTDRLAQIPPRLCRTVHLSAQFWTVIPSLESRIGRWVGLAGVWTDLTASSRHPVGGGRSRGRNRD